MLSSTTTPTPLLDSTPMPEEGSRRATTSSVSLATQRSSTTLTVQDTFVSDTIESSVVESSLVLVGLGNVSASLSLMLQQALALTLNVDERTLAIVGTRSTRVAIFDQEPSRRLQERDRRLYVMAEALQVDFEVSVSSNAGVADAMGAQTVLDAVQSARADASPLSGHIADVFAEHGSPAPELRVRVAGPRVRQVSSVSVAGPWGDCALPVGAACVLELPLTRFREVWCAEATNTSERVDDRRCMGTVPFNESEPCSPSGPEPQVCGWAVGVWSDCLKVPSNGGMILSSSVPCSGEEIGHQVRRVQCLSADGRSPCESARPASSRSCACDGAALPATVTSAAESIAREDVDVPLMPISVSTSLAPHGSAPAGSDVSRRFSTSTSQMPTGAAGRNESMELVAAGAGAVGIVGAGFAISACALITATAVFVRRFSRRRRRVVGPCDAASGPIKPKLVPKACFEEDNVVDVVVSIQAVQSGETPSRNSSSKTLGANIKSPLPPFAHTSCGPPSIQRAPKGLTQSSGVLSLPGAVADDHSALRPANDVCIPIAARDLPHVAGNSLRSTALQRGDGPGGHPECLQPMVP